MHEYTQNINFMQPLFFCIQTEKYLVIVPQKTVAVNGKAQAFSCFSTIFSCEFCTRNFKRKGIIPLLLNTIIAIAKEVLSLNTRTKRLLICLAIPLLVGLTAGLATMNSMDTFKMLNKPPLSPPAWLFPVAWTILYALMGIASYLVLSSGGSGSDISSALLFYALQLAFNFAWSFLFFSFELYSFAFAWLIALWVLILITAIKFSKLSDVAAYLMLPYLAWVTFAAYLNLGIALLN